MHIYTCIDSPPPHFKVFTYHEDFKNNTARFKGTFSSTKSFLYKQLQLVIKKKQTKKKTIQQINMIYKQYTMYSNSFSSTSVDILLFNT